jgi:hypothetical protein
MGFQNAKAHEEHEKECNRRHEQNAAVVEKVATMEKSIVDINEQMRWQGDCLITIAAKMSVDLPERP